VDRGGGCESPRSAPARWRPVLEAGEQLKAGTEEDRHEVDLELVDEARLNELPTDERRSLSSAGYRLARQASVSASARPTPAADEEEQRRSWAWMLLYVARSKRRRASPGRY